jgi:hypothetical protein
MTKLADFDLSKLRSRKQVVIDMLADRDWDGRTVEQRLRILKWAQELGIDYALFRGIGWSCSKHDASVKLKRWLLVVTNTKGSVVNISA